jgi:poly(A) polymerase
MDAVKLDHAEQRRFAVDVVRKLRDAGYVAYWAGGCVRDELLQRTPKDYDVATSARPEQVRALFGERRTLAIGAAFGVIAVVGPKGAGTVEVTTFRRDAEYRDGRRPDAVEFTDAEEDARRRDFTMNALFFDPTENRVIDYVGGREDIQRRLVRAVGDAAARFNEDKLRMMRAVRMTAVFGFELEAATQAALTAAASQVTVVSPERIAQELRGMLGGAGQTTAARLLVDVGLAAAILPEVSPLQSLLASDGKRTWWDLTLDTLRQLEEHGRTSFGTALAALTLDVGRGAAASANVDEAGTAKRGADFVRAASRRWRLSNDERDEASWIVEHQFGLRRAVARPWSQVQPLLAHRFGPELLTVCAARAAALVEPPEDFEFCRTWLARPREVLDPPPLVTGNDLAAIGLRPGKGFAELLQAARDAQLDGRATTRDEALAVVTQLRAAND